MSIFLLIYRQGHSPFTTTTLLCSVLACTPGEMKAELRISTVWLPCHITVILPNEMGLPSIFDGIIRVMSQSGQVVPVPEPSFFQREFSNLALAQLGID